MPDPTTSPTPQSEPNTPAEEEPKYARLTPIGLGSALPLIPDATEDTSPTCVPTSLDQFDFDTDDEDNFVRAVAEIRSELASPEGVHAPLEDPTPSDVTIASSLRAARAEQPQNAEPSTASVFVVTAVVTAILVSTLWLIFTL